MSKVTMWRGRWRCVIKPAYSVSFLLSINIFVWQNVLYFLDAPRRYLFTKWKNEKNNQINHPPPEHRQSVKASLQPSSGSMSSVFCLDHPQLTHQDESRNSPSYQAPLGISLLEIYRLRRGHCLLRPVDALKSLTPSGQSFFQQPFTAVDFSSS